MRTLLIAAVSALFFAAIVTELTTRLWPDQYIALLLLCFVAIFCAGLLNIRLAQRGAAAGQAAPAGGGRRGAEQRERSRERAPRAKAERARRDGAGRDGAGRDGAGRDGGSVREQRPPRPEPPPSGPREAGTVKWFNRTKGFGFVIRESGEEIFVHQRSIRATGEGDQRSRPNLRDGQAVTFVVAERDKGLQAEDVVPAEDDQA
jgi:cold shock CspA family protein